MHFSPLQRKREGTDLPSGSIIAKERYIDVRSMVLELPPAPAALVLVGLAFATLSALSAAAFLLIAVFGPPGGDRFRPLLTPAEAGGEIGEDGLGEDCGGKVSCE